MDLPLDEVDTTHSYQQVPVRRFRKSRFLYRFCSFVEWLETTLLLCISTHPSHSGFSVMYTKSSLWLSPIHPPPLFQNLPRACSFPPALIPAVRTLPSVSTFFHSYHLLPNLILATSFRAYLFLLFISPPGDLRCTLLFSNSTFCSPSEKKKMMLMSVCEKKRDLL